MTDKSASFLLAFRYRPNRIPGTIRDVSQDAQPQGACETFAWSVLILEAGGKLQALVALLTGRAMIWRCWSPVNGKLPRHAVLRYRGQWIDSTVREWRDSPKPHKRAWPVGAPAIVALVMAGKWLW